MARVLAGDSRGFEGLVQRWQGRVVTLAHRFCRDRDLAEDLAQLAFLRAYRRLDTWRADGPFGRWLLRLAVNVYKSELRRPRPQAVALDDAPESADPSAHEDPGTEFDEAVRHGVAALPARYRDALTMYYFEGRDVAAAAELLGVAPGTLKARLSRGRRLLRAVMEDMGMRP